MVACFLQMLRYLVFFSEKSSAPEDIARHAAERIGIFIYWYVLLFLCNKYIEHSIQFTSQKFHRLIPVLDSRLNVLIRDEGESNSHVVEGILHNLSNSGTQDSNCENRYN